MIVEQRIKDFEKLGFGIFIHYGLYSLLEKGEWVMNKQGIPMLEYRKLVERFQPDKEKMKSLIALIKGIGARYVTITARHHDGFSLYDTRGLNEYDCVHTPYGGDFIRDFAEECRSSGLKIILYHTLHDWSREDYKSDFKGYLKYLRKSVEILCTGYGKIDGFWFDGMWDKKGEDWEENLLYGIIRKHQPHAMIINNTGLQALGAVGHIEIDSVTFERGRVFEITQGQKYRAKEMCQTLNSHWGIASCDVNYKAINDIISDLSLCRKYGANLLLNIGPKANLDLKTIERGILEELGKWMAVYGKTISALPSEIKTDDKIAFVNKDDGGSYYLFVPGLDVRGDINVTLTADGKRLVLLKGIPFKIKRISWLDDGNDLSFSQKGDAAEVIADYFNYGFNYCTRVAKIEF